MYGRQRYKKERAETAPPERLVVMLYDGIVRFVGDALAALGSGDTASAGHAVSRAIDIIGYLQATLNQGPAPELAAALDRTYLAWSSILVRGCASRDLAQIEQVLQQASTMRDAWAEAADSATREQATT